MLVTENQRLKEAITQMASESHNQRSALLPILQHVQEKYRHISQYAMQVIADQLSIHPAEVYGVVSFYSFLSTEAKGKFVIRLCRTVSCQMQNNKIVARQLENELGIQFGETTENGRFSLEWSNCLGMCDQGPALLINDQIYTRITTDKVHQLIEDCKRSFGPHAQLIKE